MAKIRILLDRENPYTRDLTEEKITVGRLTDNAIHLDEASVSSHHAELISQNDEYHLVDLGSTNGTFVNGEQVTDVVLKNDDEIRFGKVEAVFVGEEKEKEISEPLPVSAHVDALPGQASVRPESFVTSSPFVRQVKKRDPVSMGVVIAAIVGLLACIGVSVMVFLMALPS